MNLNEDAAVKVARIKTLMLGTMNDKDKLQAIYKVCFPPRTVMVWVSWYDDGLDKTGRVYVNFQEPKDLASHNIAIKKITITEGEGLTDKT